MKSKTRFDYIMAGKIICIFFFLIYAATGSHVVVQVFDESQEEFFRRVKDTLVYDLGHPDTVGGRKLYCYFNSALSPEDSFSVIGAHYYNEAEYAVIVHDKYTKGHSSFSSGNISSWRDRRWDEVGRHVLESCDTLHTQIPELSLPDGCTILKLLNIWVQAVI